MLGAIIGDIVGSPYEFDINSIKTTEFPLFTEKSVFTDDSIMTLAVAEGLMSGYGDKEKSRKEIVKAMQRWGLKYPYAGYGYRFKDWLSQENPQPYNSYGNGSAMRVSSAAWLYNTLEAVERYAEISAAVSHNHPEGIKGAKSTAVAIFIARQGGGKNEIKQHIMSKYGYNLNQTCNEIRHYCHYVESCQETVPQAMTAFLEGDSFEQVIRLAVSLGSDSDTVAAIAGSIAEAYYGIPDDIKIIAMSKLDTDLVEILNRFYMFLHT